jgi:hypothetical protein
MALAGVGGRRRPAEAGEGVGQPLGPLGPEVGGQQRDDHPKGTAQILADRSSDGAVRNGCTKG